jgi:hypothetical protein
MIVYSRKIVQFIEEITRTLKQVLSKEVGLRVNGDRFYDRQQQFSYRINVVVYNNKSMLGYFDPNFYELGFHECLMHSSKKQLHDVIRHELAHYMTFIEYGGAIQPHAAEFKAFCRRMGWGEEISNATFSLEGGLDVSEMEESSVLRKVKKLMALATSSNKNEAEQAMIKSQQLLLKHNIESEYVGGEDNEKVLLKRIMKQKRENAKMRSIATILGTFFVSIVYKRAEGFICLEILGKAVNIEIAEYVADILDSELDRLWEQARWQANLSGTVAKNSFFLGIAKGYCDKIKAFKREYSSDVTNALMVVEKELVDAQAMAYRRLSSSKSSGSYCERSGALGQQMGRELNINPGISGSSNYSEVLIGCS